MSAGKSHAGRISQAIAAGELERLAEIIRREPDVADLLALETLPDQPGRFAYMVATSYDGFPRFAVGTTDAANERVLVSSTCGAEWSARDAFKALMEAAKA